MLRATFASTKKALPPNNNAKGKRKSNNTHHESETPARLNKLIKQSPGYDDFFAMELAQHQNREDAKRKWEPGTLLLGDTLHNNKISTHFLGPVLRKRFKRA